MCPIFAINGEGGIMIKLKFLGLLLTALVSAIPRIGFADCSSSPKESP